MLDLLRPIYEKTAAYGHFGREEPEFTWETHRQGRSAARSGRAVSPAARTARGLLRRRLTSRSEVKRALSPGRSQGNPRRSR